MVCEDWYSSYEIAYPYQIPDELKIFKKFLLQKQEELFQYTENKHIKLGMCQTLLYVQEETPLCDDRSTHNLP